MTWNEIREKHKDDRDSMTQDEEESFVNDCFDAYEQEGFSSVFWSPYSDYSSHNGERFTVLRRCTTHDFDLCVLPLWDIQYADGTLSSAYPEEIVLREMKDNGYIEKS